ncbi:MAG: hypothetical protein ACJAWQ_000635 [Paraglaciecola sp.]|jgi:hypothetical protein|nr:hypothetical protein [Colwellia sp.]|tara:strand:- start:2467 stop:2952 length:486 start_codon:yes stop_codon:yes gene_type:complete
MKAYLFQSFIEKTTKNKPTIEPALSQSQWLSEYPQVELFTDSFLNNSTDSSAHFNNAGLNRVVQEIKNGNVEKGSYLVFDGLNKLYCRPTDELELIIKSIWNHGITIVLARKWQEFSPEAINDITSRIQLLSVMQHEIQESVYRSQRAKHSYHVRRAANSA